MRVGWAAVLVGACSFHAPAIFQPDDDGGRPPDGAIVDSVANDAVVGSDASVADAPPPADAAGGFCDPDPDLVACWTFDGNAVDFSGHGHDATTSLVAYVPGHDILALQRDIASDVIVADSPDLSPDTAVTIEVWFWLAALPPTTQRYLLFDKDQQYGIRINDTGIVQCSLNISPGTQATAPIATATMVWTHAACVYDGAMLRLYMNGLEVDATPLTGMVSAGTSELRIGENTPGGGSELNGLIDRMRIWTRARSAGEMCAEGCPP